VAKESNTPEEQKINENVVNDNPTITTTDTNNTLTTTQTTTQTTTSNSDNDKCSNYTDESTNLSISCLQQIWRDAGCTTTDHIFTTDFYKNSKMKDVKQEINRWVTNKDDEHRVGCYGQNNLDKVKDVVTTNMAIGLGVGAVSQIIVQKVGQRLLAKMILKSQEKGLLASAKVLSKIVMSSGSKALSRLGIAAGERAATKVAAKSAATIGESLAKKAATRVASAGPIGAALLAFDVLSLALDLGDAGGYNKMSTVESYIKIKKSIDQEMQKAFEENGGKWPSVVGPLDSLEEDELINLIQTEVSKIMSDPNSPYTAKMYAQQKKILRMV